MLTQAQARIIDEVSLRYGDITTFEQVVEVFGRTYSRPYLKRVISQLVRNGWLVRLKKGEYYITDLSHLGRTSLSVYFLANYYVRESYVSFAQALHYHGMVDQLLSSVISVSLTQHVPVLLEGVTYRYIKTQEKYFYGYDEVRVDGRMVRIATAEKALIDMIQFHRTEGAVEMVSETALTYQDELDFERLIAYLARSKRTVRRIFVTILQNAGRMAEASRVQAMDNEHGKKSSTRVHTTTELATT